MESVRRRLFLFGIFESAEGCVKMISGDEDSTAFFHLLLRKHACRIRYILHQFKRGSLNADDLEKNLEYVAFILENSYETDARRLVDEDEEIIHFNSDAVQPEVQEWLTSTFTNQLNIQKVKFKSVANVIRTGLKFDKILKRVATVAQFFIPDEIADVLEEINSWYFDVFKLNEVSENNALKYVVLKLFNEYKFMSKYKISQGTLEKFLNHLQIGYSKHNNPYHNLIHAADVTQTTHWMLSQTGMIEYLSDLEVFSCIFSAMLHDYEHTGHTNNFHVQSASDIALLYNDRSVLENHHVSSIYRLMHEYSDTNILSGLSTDEFMELRNLTIEIVLATDMSTHFAQMKTVKNMLQSTEGISNVKAMCLIVHCCDISHPAKTWDVHYKWTMSGDLEASMGLPYSPLCDRNTVNVANSQIGFIDFIVEPTMTVCSEMMNTFVEQVILADVQEKDEDQENSLSLTRPKRLPLSMEGKLIIPHPWVDTLQDNKAKWREQNEERKKENE